MEIKKPQSIPGGMRPLEGTAPTQTASALSPNAIVFHDVFAVRAPRMTLQPDAEKLQAFGDLAALQKARSPFDTESVEIVGNPFLVIPFSTKAEIAAGLFEREKTQAYHLAVPPNAVVIQDLNLFRLKLVPEKDSEQVLSRTVVVDANGRFQGAECQSANELRALLEAFPEMKKTVYSSMGASDTSSTLALRQEDDGSFTASVSEENSVRLNNFGVPHQPVLNLIGYHLDSFAASA